MFFLSSSAILIDRDYDIFGKNSILAICPLTALLIDLAFLGVPLRLWIRFIPMSWSASPRSYQPFSSTQGAISSVGVLRDSSLISTYFAISLISLEIRTCRCVLQSPLLTIKPLVRVFGWVSSQKSSFHLVRSENL